jgi:hypothetical protein
VSAILDGNIVCYLNRRVLRAMVHSRTTASYLLRYDSFKLKMARSLSSPFMCLYCSYYHYDYKYYFLIN